MEEKEAKIFFAAGGTAGHIFPALAVAAELRQQQPKSSIIFLGTGKELEHRLIEEAGFRLQVLPSSPLLGQGLGGILRLLLMLPRAVAACFALLRKEKATAIIGFGGYPAFVPVLCAWLLGIRSIIHEQNVRVGVANKILSLFAHRVFSVRGAHGFWRRTVEQCGNPVKSEFYKVKPYVPPSVGEEFCLLVFGGSQGSQALNNAVIKLIPFFKERKLRLLHQCGNEDFELLQEAYRSAGLENVLLQPFFSRMWELYEQAHLVICRAGALSTAELVAVGRPAIFVPLPIAGGHQRENVRFLEEREACIVIEQNEDLSEKLRLKLVEVLAQTGKLAILAQRMKELDDAQSSSPAQRMVQALIGV